MFIFNRLTYGSRLLKCLQSLSYIVEDERKRARERQEEDPCQNGLAIFSFLMDLLGFVYAIA